MKILFSPSETKIEGGIEKYLNENTLIFPALYKNRLEILKRH